MFEFNPINVSILWKFGFENGCAYFNFAFFNQEIKLLSSQKFEYFSVSATDISNPDDKCKLIFCSDSESGTIAEDLKEYV